MLSILPCFLFIYSSNGNAQHSSALVPGNLEGQTSSKMTEAGSNTTMQHLQETPITPLSMSDISLGDEIVEENTTLQNQQQQNEQTKLTNAEPGSIEPVAVDDQSNLYSSQHKQSDSSTVQTSMYLYL